MRSNLTKTPQRGARRARSRHQRAWMVCGVLISLWAAIHYGRDMPVLFQSRRVVQESKPELLSGSILFVPSSGNICRQSLIDNATGQIRDNGLVDCTTAKVETEKSWAARMALQRQAAIRDSFANR